MAEWRHARRSSSRFAWLCGLGFAANKAVEYTELLHEGRTPMTDSFYAYYFVFTRIHATHLLVGSACSSSRGS